MTGETSAFLSTSVIISLFLISLNSPHILLCCLNVPNQCWDVKFRVVNMEIAKALAKALPFGLFSVLFTDVGVTVVSRTPHSLAQGCTWLLKGSVVLTCCKRERERERERERVMHGCIIHIMIAFPGSLLCRNIILKGGGMFKFCFAGCAHCDSWMILQS